MDEEIRDVTFTVTKIKWDAPSSEVRKLPKTIKIKVPARQLEYYEDTEEFISNKISDQAGYTHKGFETKPEIENIMEEKIDLSLNRSLPELESSYWEFLEATEGEDSSEWSKSVQEDLSALEGYLMKMDLL